MTMPNRASARNASTGRSPTRSSRPHFRPEFETRGPRRTAVAQRVPAIDQTPSVRHDDLEVGVAFAEELEREHGVAAPHVGVLRGRAIAAEPDVMSPRQ